LDEPDISSKFNAMWHEMAVEFQLFDERGEFLLAIQGHESSGDSHPHWAKVRLMGSWDIFETGTRGRLTGFEHGYPEFAMSSLDGRTVMRGTTWSTAVGCIVMREPHRSETLRRHISGPYMQFDLGAFERRAAEAWLQIAD
jgi:hypothetical protein